jgi:hypothetical protein
MTRLRGTIRQRLTAGGMCLLAVAGCDDGPGPGEEQRTVSYQFALAAFGEDSMAERVRYYQCVVHGFFAVAIPLVPQGSVRFPLMIERQMAERRGSHFETTSADSLVEDALLTYSGLGDDSLTFTLGAGPYAIALGPGGQDASAPGEYSGPWTCGAGVPLATDSTLGAYGYDPSLELAGTWRVSELLPVE